MDWLGGVLEASRSGLGSLLGGFRLRKVANMASNLLPKPSQNRAKDFQKRLQGVLRRPFRKEVEKVVIFRTPQTVKMRLPHKRELNFHFSQGPLKDLKNRAKMEPESSRRRSEVAPRAFPKKC